MTDRINKEVYLLCDCGWDNCQTCLSTFDYSDSNQTMVKIEITDQINGIFLNPESIDKLIKSLNLIKQNILNKGE